MAGVLGSFGLGIAAFYLNFVYRALGFVDTQIGLLAACQALGVVVGAVPATWFARRHPRRTSLIVGGTVTGIGLALVLRFDTVPVLALAAALGGGGGILVASTGAALLADASRGIGRVRLIGQQVALGTGAAFLASVAAGGLAAPVASLIGAPEGNVRAVRALVAIGALLAGLSIIPVLFLRPAAIPPETLATIERRSLLRRFVMIQVAFGFGAGSFMPFLNLFFVDRFGVPFAALGVILGILAVAGSLGALVHGRLVVPRLGSLNGIVATQVASLPLAISAAFLIGPATLPIVLALLAARGFLMYGSSASLSAFALASFTPAERAGAIATLSIGYYGAYAAAAAGSGWLRSVLGDPGWTANLLLLCAGYGVAALLQLRLLGGHLPRGDADGAMRHAAADSTA